VSFGLDEKSYYIPNLPLIRAKYTHSRNPRNNFQILLYCYDLKIYEFLFLSVAYLYYKKYSTLFFIYGLISDDLGIILATYAILVSIFVNL